MFIYEQVKSLEAIDTNEGFGLEAQAQKYYAEILKTENMIEELCSLISKTEGVADIYTIAEEEDRRIVRQLPVLIHGNISQCGTRKRYLIGSLADNAEVICTHGKSFWEGNDVMNEDWIIRAMLKYNISNREDII